MTPTIVEAASDVTDTAMTTVSKVSSVGGKTKRKRGNKKKRRSSSAEKKKKRKEGDA
jgi:hypothetical protein